MDQRNRTAKSGAGDRKSTSSSSIGEALKHDKCRNSVLPGEGQASSASDPKPSASDLALAGRRAADRIRLKHHFDESEERMRLHAAATKNDGDLIIRLVIEGAKVNVLDDDNRTPLHVAAGEGAEKAVDALIKSGADVDIRDIGGNAPLHAGVPPGNLRVIRSLIGKGADVNAPNMDGNTPLHIAALSGTHDAAEELLKQGADIKRKNARDMTPRQEASEKRHKNVDAILDLAERGH